MYPVDAPTGWWPNNGAISVARGEFTPSKLQLTRDNHFPARYPQRAGSLTPWNPRPSDSRRGELRVERIAVHQDAGALAEGVLLGVEVIGEGGGDHRGDLGQVVLEEAAGGQRRGADPQPGGVHRRPWVEGDRVAVDGDADGLQPVLCRLP